MKSFKQFLHESSNQSPPPDPILTDLAKKGKINTSTREILSVFPGYNNEYFDNMKKAQTDPKYADVLKKYNIPDWNEIDTPLTVRPMTIDDKTIRDLGKPILGRVDQVKDPHTIIIDKELAGPAARYGQPARHTLAHESSHTAKAQQPGWLKNNTERVMPIQPGENEALDKYPVLDKIKQSQYLTYFGNANEAPAHARSFKTKYAEKTGTPWMPGDRQDPAKWKIMRDDIIGVSPIHKIIGDFFGSEEGEKVMDLAKRNEQKRTPQAVAEAWSAKYKSSINSPFKVPR